MSAQCNVNDQVFGHVAVRPRLNPLIPPVVVVYLQTQIVENNLMLLFQENGAELEHILHFYSLAHYRSFRGHFNQLGLEMAHNLM